MKYYTSRVSKAVSEIKPLLGNKESFKKKQVLKAIEVIFKISLNHNVNPYNTSKILNYKFMELHRLKNTFNEMLESKKDILLNARLTEQEKSNIEAQIKVLEELIENEKAKIN